MEFKELYISEEILKAIADMGFKSPSPIQEETIPPLLEGRDLIGQAQTGTGKTAAFAIPIIERIANDHPELFEVAKRPGDLPEKEREELRKIIADIFKEKMEKHNIK